ncbi:4Fe-4S binding domain protein [Anaerofustis stercorihominis DSM 17244]|uniref:Ferredoxin n=1 Tax=Anaerofustis stercorihominis DSM 17244 TaxID=445971 RepID=B1C823_9FIRM|nr:4Fe-4S binding protein [Anaerofustis stercorihominis]EDS73160.1 4Fe-4S binding domain protein [Anaerofustis stercorihominis DSM 17244]
MKEAKDYFKFLVEEIHSTTFATVDDNGLPETCVIDLMLCDDEALYFLTAKGKGFYDRLIKRKFVSLSGMKGLDTMSTKAVSVKGKVCCIGKEKLDEIFEKNTYINEIYTSEESKMALAVFKIYQGVGEYVDLSVKPMIKRTFSFGGENVEKRGYEITDDCFLCGKCIKVCSFNAIEEAEEKYKITEDNCLECGNCYSVCPAGAVIKY